MAANDREVVIRDRSEITASWLAATLCAAGHLPAGTVLALTVTLWRRKNYSDLYALHATYAGNPGLPASFMLKISRPANSSTTARRRRWKEHEFYARVAPTMDEPPIPRQFAAAFDPTDSRSHLLMEDLTASHVRPPMPLPPTPDQLRGAIDSLAQIHGRWWAHPDIVHGAVRRDEAWIARKSARMRSTLARFLAECGEYLPVATRLALETVGSAWPAILRRSATSPLTLVHGDAHPWNFLFPRDPKGGRARLLDWEGWDLEPGPHDLASLLALHLPMRFRSALEDELLERYVHKLRESGVQQSMQACRDDYRRAVARRVYTPVGLWSRGSDARSWWPALERVTAAFSDLRCAEVLEDEAAPSRDRPAIPAQE